MDNQFNREAFLNKASDLLAKTIGVNELNCTIDFDTKLVSGIGSNKIELSSIDYVRFLVEIENTFDIVYNFETVIYTIGDIYDYICDYYKRRECGN